MREQQGTSRREWASLSHPTTTTVWTEMNAVSNISLKNWGKAGGEPSTSSTPRWGSVEILWWSLDWPTSAHLFQELFHHHSQGWLSFQVVTRGGYHYCINTFRNAELSSLLPSNIMQGANSELSSRFDIGCYPLQQPKNKHLSLLKTDIKFTCFLLEGGIHVWC